MIEEKKFHYLSFTKRERSGIVLLVIINIIIVTFPELYVYFTASEKQTSPEILKQFYGLSEKEDSTENKNRFRSAAENSSEKKPPMRLFKFDPNTIRDEQWRLLGLNEKTINTISRFITKGGLFHKPEDLRKIWGMPQYLADTLIPYVHINAEEVRFSGFKKGDGEQRPNRGKIEINHADSVILESLPGIGPTLSHRIIAYREKLKGFYQIEQLKEVWGIRDSAYEKLVNNFTLDVNLLRPFDINNAAMDELKTHPYFGYKVARAIVEFRNQHGLFKSLEEVQNIVSIDAETFKKISHYLIVKK